MSVNRRHDRFRVDFHCGLGLIASSGLFRCISNGTSLKLAKDGLMMKDFLTDDTNAILLLCGIFGKDRSAKPLSLTEYSSLVRWLIGVKMRPEDLLKKENIPEASIGSGIEKQRLESLLGRGIQLGFAVEEWQRNGIWIISRSDADYPARYKIHLKDKAPPLLFGVGNRSLLNGGGLGIVGSRNVDQEGEAFTRQVAELCAYNRMPVVSGGARGVDQISMTAALEAGGLTIGVLAENLLKKSVVRSARHAIADGRLLLLSPCHPMPALLWEQPWEEIN
ncbi:DNA recombination-mediator protein A [Candidatus Electrothrix communis]|uniref:DNA recombination-mediator protein A n=1 Tax=Candidatus Electrothrix communis TaxID=1859133 RepID=A0A444J7A9_9BACT|nr:DNA recombination-mediator protein A [Candidatus Electrothrix communis]